MELRTTITVLILASIALVSGQTDPASNQLFTWAGSSSPNTVATSFLGSPLPSLTASQTSSQNLGPILLTDTNYLEMMAHFVRERIPERVVHARGAAAHGEFIVTHDITKYTKADIFNQIGKVTDIFVRFSTVGGESGSADTVNDPRGFAIKFYTREGNWDLVGNNLPIFPIRDPILFPSFVHTRKRNPATHLPDKNMFWDFISLRPETTHHTIQLFSDLGIPANLRVMDGFGVHTFKFVNRNGERSFVRFTHKSQQGIATLTWAEAARLAGTDPDNNIKDLYNAIEQKNYPKWKMFIQIMTPNQTATRNYAFDPVQIWPEEEFPLIPVGEFVLNRNAQNYFNEIEQVAFDPGNLVPGIEMSQDRLLQGRSFAYNDAQRYRLGANFLQLPINFPKNQTAGIRNYMRDGRSCIFSQGGAPNYFPNSFNGPQPNTQFESHGSEFVNGMIGRFDNGLLFDNFGQATKFYQKLRQDEKDRLVSNIVTHLSGADISVQNRVSENIFAKVDPELNRQVLIGLGITRRASPAPGIIPVPSANSNNPAPVPTTKTKKMRTKRRAS